MLIFNTLNRAFGFEMAIDLLRESIGYRRIERNSYLDSWEYNQNSLNAIRQDAPRMHGGYAIAEYIHQFNEVIAIPWKKTLHFLAYTLEPFPGRNKGSYWREVAVKTSYLALFLFFIPVGACSATMNFTLRSCTHCFRPRLSYLYTDLAENRDVEEELEAPLHIRTHNLAFTYEFHRIFGNLRPTLERAREIGRWIMEDPPNVICFQEAFHEDGVRLLCGIIREKYPHIIHNICPNAMGLNSGLMIASKYPIKEASFRIFNNIVGVEKLSSRGLLRFRIDKGGVNIDVYTTHLQALLSRQRVLMRREQLEMILKWIKEDEENLIEKADIQILAGDLNASRVTTWGLDYFEDHEFLERILENFDDPFLFDHDWRGNRISSQGKYVFRDSPNGDCLEEPKGSWYYGPDLKASLMHLSNGLENNADLRRRNIRHLRKSNWGTPGWGREQEAFTARLDYLLRKKGKKMGSWADRVEIRRIRVDSSSQSAPSDHLAVDGEFWVH